MQAENLFPVSYEASRERFRADLEVVRRYWPEARLESYTLRDHPGLTIDWIRSEACREPRRRLILSSGLHGIEGYVGSAILHLFVRDYLPRLDPTTTGLVLIHSVNPWGMKHRRRVNANNVDLNRNFIDPTSAFADLNTLNPEYAQLYSLLNPRGVVSLYGREKIRWRMRLVKTLIKPGIATLKAATLLGQYRFPRGIYYGGDCLQEETEVMMALFREAIVSYAQVVHLDMHTGYGPRARMLIVNSPLEKRPLASFAEAFDYPDVVSVTPEEFYAIHGDWGDWIYRMAATLNPNGDLYATTFEFGTLGDGLLDSIRSLQALVFENRVYHEGASESARHAIEAEFLALFYPQKRAWRSRALELARRGFEAVLGSSLYPFLTR